MKQKDEEIFTERSRTLRKNMTPQEKKLWYRFLSKHKVKFYRQKVINPYILDFYSSQCKLVIELDGSQHFGESGLCEYDKKRNEFLEHLGLYVLHIPNNEIDNNFNNVCDGIDELIKLRLK